MYFRSPLLGSDYRSNSISGPEGHRPSIGNKTSITSSVIGRMGEVDGRRRHHGSRVSNCKTSNRSSEESGRKTSPSESDSDIRDDLEIAMPRPVESGNETA